MILHICQEGYEAFLAKELAPPAEKGPGWVRSASGGADLCFAHYSLLEPAALEAPSAKGQAQALADFFLSTSREERYEEAWPLTVEGEGKRARVIEELVLELLKKRMARVARLARPGRPEAGRRRGLFALLAGGRVHASREAVFGGQRRMADDPQAPSRSYLKAEEAYAVLGRGPQPGESVVDLGAAPGGWSYSAAKRGARVDAVDNGPLKGGALNHPLIAHRPEDAFKLRPRPADWLFCDMVEDPDRVLDLVGAWIGSGNCRRFVVNLKYGRLDPLPLLRRVRAALAPRCTVLKLRHLYHDREEITAVGEVS